MNPSRGDIILADLPFSDRAGSKVRPGLVVQADVKNRRLDDIIIALITSTIHRAGIESTQLLIDITTPEGQQSGLLHTSAVKCEHLITFAPAVDKTSDRPATKRHHAADRRLAEGGAGITVISERVCVVLLRASRLRSRRCAALAGPNDGHSGGWHC